MQKDIILIFRKGTGQVKEEKAWRRSDIASPKPIPSPVVPHFTPLIQSIRTTSSFHPRPDTSSSYPRPDTSSSYPRPEIGLELGARGKQSPPKSGSPNKGNERTSHNSRNLIN